MSTLVSRSTRTAKKVEKPRPLKSPGTQNRHSTVEGRLGIVSVDDIMALVETIRSNITNGNFDKTVQQNIHPLCVYLKSYGTQLEAIYKDQLDRAFVTFRNASQDIRLDYQSRINLLQVIELRACNWQYNDNINAYYKQKTNNIDTSDMLSLLDTTTMVSTNMGPASPTTPQPSVLLPGEIIKNSGKFTKPTKIPGKNYCKDEVVIRNSDSGKVMGIKGRRVHMIEELSETIISFQRVSPGAKERLVQITGPNEGRINDAKYLIEDTIRRNASPVRLEQAEHERMGGSSSSLNSSASDDSSRLMQSSARRTALHHSFSTNDANLGEYKHTVTIGNESLKVTGTNLELVKTGMLVLEEYFSRLQDHCEIGAGDFYTSFDESPETPLSVTAPLGKLTMGDRVGSQESAESHTTSESEETYKAIPAELDDTTIKVLRQPLFPDASKAEFEQVEKSGRTPDISARNRRAFFAHTNSQAKDEETGAKVELPVPDRITYSQHTLLALATSKFSRALPLDWERISQFPTIVKQCAEMFDPAAYRKKWEETEGSTSVLSATESGSPDPE